MINFVFSFEYLSFFYQILLYMLFIDVDGSGCLESLKKLFIAYKGCDPLRIVPLEQSGSDRRYFRLSSQDWSCIGTFVPDAEEGECFIRLASDFRKDGRAVPEVFAASADFHCYIQEDLGDRSLFSVLSSTDVASLVKDTLAKLVSLQKTPCESWSNDCMCRDFSLRQVMWDLNYFKYEFLKPSNLLFDEDRLEDDFQVLAQRLLDIKKDFWGFMMRDCQSRNVMLRNDEPVFIDFQGGRFGPSLYDAVSFLWQARAGFNAEFRNEMLDYYTGLYCQDTPFSKSDMTVSLNDMVLFRTLQVLGAYGFRGLVQRKAHFLLSIPSALRNLGELLSKGAVDCFPELRKVAAGLVADPQFQPVGNVGTLTVEICSFSYKKGYPENLTGNGGGFMFDCRAMKNPGRFEKYRQLTGRDKPVVEFLEKCGEVDPFLKAAWSLTDPAIERYLSRGFSHLQIGFGCTGGQHRSVYCAEKTAAHIRSLFPEANVILLHREHPESLNP